MKSITLYDGSTIPAMGLGTWQGNANDLPDALSAAIDIGYRHIDCAAVYANEAIIGNFLKQRSNVSRDALWITSKLWCSYFKPEQVLPACKQTLHDLQLDYLDAYLIHWPVALNKKVGLNIPDRSKSDDFYTLEQVPTADTWQAMEELVQQGLVRYIGVSNFSIKKIAKLLETAKIHPALNQVENHPYLAQNELVKFCQDNDIVITAYSPFGSPGRPKEIIADNEPQLFEDAVLKDIAQQHSATVAQVILAWQMQRDIAVIPKSTNSERLKQNFSAQDIKLTASQVSAINNLDKHFRYSSGAIWIGEGSPYTVENLFDE